MVRTFPAQLNGMSNSFCKSACCFFLWKGELAGLFVLLHGYTEPFVTGKDLFNAAVTLLGGDFVPRRSLFAYAHRHG